MRVCILGPLPAQFRRLQWHAGPDAELVLLAKDRLNGDLPDADLYIVWTRFVSHAASRRVLTAAGWRKVVVHRGGLTTLGEVVAKWTRTGVMA